jgi:hypothetical protein
LKYLEKQGFYRFMRLDPSLVIGHMRAVHRTQRDAIPRRFQRREFVALLRDMKGLVDQHVKVGSVIVREYQGKLHEVLVAAFT